MKRRQNLFTFFCYILICTFLSNFQGLSYGQENDEKDVPREQQPVQDRKVGDSLVENLAELPGKLITAPFYFTIELLKLLHVQKIYLRTTDLLTSEDGTRTLRPIFSPGGGGGATFRQRNLLHPGMTFRAHASFANKTRRLVHGDLRDPGLFSQKWGLHLRGFNWRKPTERFYGIGNDAKEEDRTDYLDEETSFEGTILFSPSKETSFGLGFAYSDVAIEDGRDNGQPNLDSLFTPLEVPGFFGEKMWTVTLKIYSDSRNEAGHPRRGAEQYVAMQLSKDRNLGYFKFIVDLRRYFNLFYRRVLAVRVRTEITDDLGNREVPFYRLPGLGGEDLLKGYQSYRFQDDDLAYVSAEYRVPLNPMVNLTLFVEEGRVFQNMLDDFTFSDWHYSYGGGLRFRASNGGLITSFIIAKSDEDTRILFGLNTEIRGF